MKVYAHRGSSGTHPENTIAAFQAAANLPVYGVEFDVHMTVDGELVIIHDETINRTSNGVGHVKDMTLEELKKYDFGSWFSPDFIGQQIPTLSEVLEVFQKTNHHINIELKSDIFPYEGMGEKVISVIEQMGLNDRVVISSFDHAAIRSVKQDAPHIETAVLFSEVLVDAYEYSRNVPADALHIFLPASVRPASGEAIAKGAVVRVYTVNEMTHAEALMKIGVDAIFTDFPEKMYDFIQRKS